MRPLRAPVWLASLLAVGSLATSFFGGCSSSSSSTGPLSGGGDDGAAPNGCLAAGPGFVCQAKPCTGALIGEEDYFCGTKSDFCCGPAGDGGSDASDDANVFVGDAKFDVVPADGATSKADAKK